MNLHFTKNIPLHWIEHHFLWLCISTRHLGGVAGISMVARPGDRVWAVRLLQFQSQPADAGRSGLRARGHWLDLETRLVQVLSAAK